MATAKALEKEDVSPENSVANSVRERAHGLVDKTADKTEEVEKTLSAQKAIASESFDETRTKVEKGIKEQYANVEKKAKENPLITLGIAFAAGAVVSRLMAKK